MQLVLIAALTISPHCFAIDSNGDAIDLSGYCGQNRGDRPRRIYLENIPESKWDLLNPRRNQDGTDADLLPWFRDSDSTTDPAKNGTDCDHESD